LFEILEEIWRECKGWKSGAEIAEKSLSLQEASIYLILGGQGRKTPLLEQEGTTSDSESGW
jgi:hypothetical protein